MSSIHLLDDELINKIAAGEVVERPASVVKELVENSIDAGASRVTVNLKNGGLDHISVTDDGSGMTKEDAGMAIKRHATSKIRSLDDLVRGQSMGFRGEALASIAAVSDFTMQGGTGDGRGYRLIAGQKGAEIADWDGPRGTAVIVDHLFRTTPARRKFLKSSGAEYAASAELMHALAVAHPGVTFTLTHNQKQQFTAAAIECEMDGVFWGEDVIRSRVATILPPDHHQPLIYRQASNDYLSVECLISPPSVTVGTGKKIFTFANQRWIKDRLLRMGVMRGYHSHLLRGKYPICFLFVTIDPSLVDFNAHPSKTEARFQYGKEIQDLIAMTIRDGIRSGAWAEPPISSAPIGQESLQPAALNHRPAFSPGRSGTPSASPATAGFNSIKTSRVSHEGVKSQQSLDFSTAPSKVPVASLQSPAAPSNNTNSVDGLPWGELTFIGSFARCYLLFEVHNKLLVVDQHAFHERIIFERLDQQGDELTRTQDLLVPEAIEISHSQWQLLQDHSEMLEKIGFGFAFIKPGLVEVLSVPMILTDKDLERFIGEICQKLQDQHSIAGWQDDLIATLACHSAVRAGEELSADDLKVLLVEASKVDFYLNCPHGRPVFKWWNEREVGGWFER